MIETEQEYSFSKETADRFRKAREELLAENARSEPDYFRDLQIASIEGQILKLHEEIREYESRVIPK